MNTIEQTPAPLEYPEHGRGKKILWFGILSLLLFGPFLGIPAWRMGITDLKKIGRNIINPSELNNTSTGKLLGTIGTFLSLGPVIILAIAMFADITLFGTSPEEANRQAVINDLNSIGKMAQRYYRTPAIRGGGHNSFLGFMVPASHGRNANGRYHVESLHLQEIAISGTGTEKGSDGKNLVEIAIVTPTEITISKEN
jgi:hypothetical protein